MENTKNEQQCVIHDVSNSYYVRRHMFFAVTNPVVKDNLTKDEAEKLCKELNDDEQQNGDGLYVHYEVHNCC